MASPDPEGALEDETAAQPGARAGQPRGGDDRRVGNVSGEPRDEPAGRPEHGADAFRVGAEAAVDERRCREDAAPDGRPDALAREVAGESRRVPDEREARAGEPARAAATDRVRVAAERREPDVGGKPPGRAESLEETLEPAADRQPAERPDADVQEVALREVPAVALEVGLRDQLRRPVPRCQRAEPRGADARLALLRHDDVLVVRHRAQRAGDRTAVAAGAEDRRRAKGPVVGVDLDAAGHLAHLAHANALTDPRAGPGGPS